MKKIFSIKKNYLTPYEDIYEFTIKAKENAFFKKYLYISLFVLITSITLLASFSVSFLSAMKLAKYWIFNENSNNNEWQNQLINNYVYITNGISAAVAFLSSISSFFLFKDGYLKNRKLFTNLQFELIQYENQFGYYDALESKVAKQLLRKRVLNFMELECTNSKPKKTKGGF